MSDQQFGGCVLRIVAVVFAIAGFGLLFAAIDLRDCYVCYWKDDLSPIMVFLAIVMFIIALMTGVSPDEL